MDNWYDLWCQNSLSKNAPVIIFLICMTWWLLAARFDPKTQGFERMWVRVVMILQFHSCWFIGANFQEERDSWIPLCIFMGCAMLRPATNDLSGDGW